MMRFTVLVIALALAPGLNSALVQTRPEVPVISTLPGVIPTPQLRPLPIPIDPELLPEPIPENEEAIHPELITVNPCDACFSYMTSIIEQLTEVAVPEEHYVPRPLPEGVLPEENHVPRPLPESVLPEDLRPLPTPEEGEIEISPIPLPSVLPTEAEAEVELAIQDRPLPEFIIRK